MHKGGNTLLTLIKNGFILDPASGKEGNYDILIKDDIIVEVQKSITTQVEKTIDARGLYVMPGFVDLHVHLRDTSVWRFTQSLRYSFLTYNIVFKIEWYLKTHTRFQQEYFIIVL